MRLGGSATALAAAAIFGLAVCGAPISGRLVGGIVFSGRAYSEHHYQPGLVVVGQHGHFIAQQHLKRNQQFHFTLAPGTYDLAYSVCSTQATIVSGDATRENVVCVFH